jgi:hypothetical protein
MLFRTTAVHHISDQMVPEGTLVGDGTPFPISGPSMFMEPLDDEAKKVFEARMARWGGKRPPAEIMLPPPSHVEGQRIGGQGPKAAVPSPAAAMAPGGAKPGPEGVQVKGD